MRFEAFFIDKAILSVLEVFILVILMAYTNMDFLCILGLTTVK